MKKLHLLGALCVCLFISNTATAQLLTFHFTGRLTVFQPNGSCGDPSCYPSSNLEDYNVVRNIPDPLYPGVPHEDSVDAFGFQTNIEANLEFDPDTGLGSSNLTVVLDTFLGSESSIHSITLNQVDGSPNFIEGHMLGNFGDPVLNPGTQNMPMQIMWDATGLINAINGGMQVGDIISGDELWSGGSLINPSIGSATPWSESYQFLNPGGACLGTSGVDCFLQGPAPLATAIGTAGLGAGTSLEFIAVHLDIGSGNSIQMISDGLTTVPIPGALWLFGSGLLGLIGISRRTKLS